LFKEIQLIGILLSIVNEKNYGVFSRMLGYGSAQELLYVGEGSKCKPLSRILTLVPQPIGQEEGPKSLEGST
jgi:hypothetical protein